MPWPLVLVCPACVIIDIKTRRQNKNETQDETHMVNRWLAYGSAFFHPEKINIQGVWKITLWLSVHAEGRLYPSQ